MTDGILWKIGALAPDLAEQAEAWGYTLKNAELHQKKVDYLVFLHIHDVLTDSQYEKALDRVFHNQIHKDLGKEFFITRSTRILVKEGEKDDTDKDQLKRHILDSDLTAIEKRYLEGLVDGGRWIPCSERMPESGLTVHVFAVEGECELFFDAHYLKTSGEWHTYDVRARLGANGFTFAVHPDVKITHWMPIADKPEGV